MTEEKSFESLLEHNKEGSKRAVGIWNKCCIVGQKVMVIKDDNTIVETFTTSEAWLLGGHTAVVKVEGISGGFLLERVSPI